MSLPVVLRPEAQSEFDDAFDWYENQRPGLGVRFAERVQEVFDRISVNPYLHAVAFMNVRKAVVKRFPYCIFYEIEPFQILVIAVFHSKRDPSVWQARSS